MTSLETQKTDASLAGARTSSPEARLAELGFQIPAVSRPLASYVPAVRSGRFVMSSGQLPFVSGELVASGILGLDVDQETGRECARICALNGLAAVKDAVGELSVVAQVVKVVVFVASTSDFTQQPYVANGASDLLVAAFGDAGIHARSAVGVSALPLGAPVEVEVMVEVDFSRRR